MAVLCINTHICVSVCVSKRQTELLYFVCSGCLAGALPKVFTHTSIQVFQLLLSLYYLVSSKMQWCKDCHWTPGVMNYATPSGNLMDESRFGSCLV